MRETTLAMECTCDACKSIKLDLAGLGRDLYAKLCEEGNGNMIRKGYIPTDAAEGIKQGLRDGILLTVCVSHKIPLGLSSLLVKGEAIDRLADRAFHTVCGIILDCAARADAVKGQKVQVEG